MTWSGNYCTLPETIRTLYKTTGLQNRHVGKKAWGRRGVSILQEKVKEMT